VLIAGGVASTAALAAAAMKRSGVKSASRMKPVPDAPDA
jgi:hypothetical protein